MLGKIIVLPGRLRFKVLGEYGDRVLAYRVDAGEPISRAYFIKVSDILKVEVL